MSGIDNNTLLYLRGDSFNDLGPKGKAITSTGCTLDSSTKSINATSGHIYTTYTSDFAPNATSLTAEAWFKINSGGSTFTICFGGQTGYYFGDIELNVGSTDNSTALIFSSLNNSSGTQANTTSTTTGVSEAVPVGVWTHICITYDLSSKVLVMYINGQATRRYTNLTINYRGANYGVGFGYRKSNNQFLNGYIKNARISNVVRYTGNFTPQADPFTSVSVSNLSLSDNQLTFGVSKLSTNETINKVDILVNNNVVKTITSNYDSISYTIDESIYSYGDNVIEVRAYYFDDYYTSASITHRKELNLEEFEPIAALPTTASFDDVIAHLGRVKFANRAMLNNLQVLLEDKGFNTGENPRLSTLIKVVKDLSNSNSADITEYINQIIALESEVADLKAKEIDHTKLEYIGVHGAFSGGTYPYNYEFSYSGATRAHYMLRIPTNGAKSVKCTFSGYKATAHPYNSSSAFISDLGWFTSGTTYALPAGTDFVIMYFGKTDGSAFTTTDINTIRSNFKYEFTNDAGTVGPTKTYLYKAGDTCTSITGGWDSTMTLPTSYWGSGVSKGTMNSNNIYLKATSGRTAQHRTTSNKIDFSNYSKLWIEYNHTQKTGTYAHTTIRLLNGLSESGDWVKRSSSELAYTTSKATAYIDVSDITGSYYVNVIGSVENTGAVDFYVYNIWLE